MEIEYIKTKNKKTTKKSLHKRFRMKEKYIEIGTQGLREQKQKKINEQKRKIRFFFKLLKILK